jgi:hypothetical protein
MRPIDKIYQVAFVVDDLEEAAMHWIREGGAGPFTLFRHFRMLDAKVAPGLDVPDISIAMGFSGTVNIELIKVHSYGPSVYGLSGHPRAPFMHHVAGLSRDVEQTVREYEKKGCPRLLSARFEPASALAYVDTRARTGCITEFIQYNPQVEEILNALEAQAATWDGKNPLREFGG